MAKLEFDKLEKNVITMFLDEMKDIPLVEGVYIRAIEDGNYNISVDINVVINNSNYYFDKVGDFSRDIDSEAQLVLDTIDYYNSFALDTINFSSSNALSFIWNKTEIAAATDLVSGTILFDRFGRLTIKKQQFESVLTPYFNSYEIGNTDSIKNKISGLI